MMDRSLLFAGLFSLGIHGILAIFLIPPSPRVSLGTPLAVEVIWEPASDHSQKNEKPRKILKKEASLERTLPSYKKVSSLPLVSLDSRVPRLREDGNNSKGSEKKENSNPAKVAIQKNSTRKAYRPLPKYPWICRKRGQEGIVAVMLKTNSEGQVVEASVHKSSGHPLLDDAALEAFKSWIFAEGPLTKTLSIAFRLKG